FTRANQAGWGTTTNNDGVPNAAWGMDGDGRLSYVAILNHTGSYGYPGSTNLVGVASASGAKYNGGGALGRLSVSAAGHVTPYAVVNACADKSCYYGARMHTSQSRLELAKRVYGGTTILVSTPFTLTANSIYWMRLDVAPGSSSATIAAKIWVNGAS